MRVCNRCVMDSTVPDIQFTEDGCNYCESYLAIKKTLPRRGIIKKIDEIKRAGKNRPYDCVLGVSGGKDSSYVCHLAKNWRLRVLLVSFDNGWDSKIAQENVKHLVSHTLFDHYVYSVEEDEFHDLQLAYLKASVVDIEVPTDHGIMALLYHVAKKHKVKYILSGANLLTEKMIVRQWRYNFLDHRNLINIHKRFGTLPLKTFPHMTLTKLAYYEKMLGINRFHVLNYINYDVHEAENILKKDYDLRSYGLKHHESLWTKFYQAYILPNKFKADKRKPYLSCLVLSRQLTREEALEELEKPYPHYVSYAEKKWILGKLKLTEREFENFMQLPIRQHSDYGTNKWTRRFLRVAGLL